MNPLSWELPEVLAAAAEASPAEVPFVAAAEVAAVAVVVALAAAVVVATG